MSLLFFSLALFSLSAVQTCVQKGPPLGAAHRRNRSFGVSALPCECSCAGCRCPARSAHSSAAEYKSSTSPAASCVVMTHLRSSASRGLTVHHTIVERAFKATWLFLRVNIPELISGCASVRKADRFVPLESQQKAYELRNPLHGCADTQFHMAHRLPMLGNII